MICSVAMRSRWTARVSGALRRNGDAGVPGGGGELADRLAQQRRQVERLQIGPEPAAGEPRHAEHRRGALHIAHDAVLDAPEPLLELLWGAVARLDRGHQQVDLAEDGRHRIAQLVGGDGHEGVPRCHGRGQLGDTALQLVMRGVRRCSVGERRAWNGW